MKKKKHNRYFRYMVYIGKDVIIPLNNGAHLGITNITKYEPKKKNSILSLFKSSKGPDNQIIKISSEKEFY